jgi:ATP-binding protein involved in chromosome partitioning
MHQTISKLAVSMYGVKGLRRSMERRKQIQEQEEGLRARMSKVKHKIAVISGKGGVGKSTVTVNLAIAFAMHGHANKVGILDADIHGPSVPKMLGLTGQRLQAGPPGIFPASGPLGIKVVSMDFLLPDENAPVIWRGPLKMTAIRQFLSDIVWGELDLLLIDLASWNWR